MKSRPLFYFLILVFIQILIPGFVILPLTEHEELISTENKNYIISPENNFPKPGKGCIASECHSGILPIREHYSEMAKAIYIKGDEAGDPNGCVVFHMGSPGEK